MAQMQWFDPSTDAWGNFNPATEQLPSLDEVLVRWTGVSGNENLDWFDAPRGAFQLMHWADDSANNYTAGATSIQATDPDDQQAHNVNAATGLVVNSSLASAPPTVGHSNVVPPRMRIVTSGTAGGPAVYEVYAAIRCQALGQQHALPRTGGPSTSQGLG